MLSDSCSILSSLNDPEGPVFAFVAQRIDEAVHACQKVGQLQPRRCHYEQDNDTSWTLLLESSPHGVDSMLLRPQTIEFIHAW